MRYFLSVTLFHFIFNSSFGQGFELPIFKEGVYNQTTIFEYFGRFPFSGQGYIGTGSGFSSQPVSGMEVKLVVDSVVLSDTSIHAGAIKINPGDQEKLKKGDEVSLPLEIWLFYAEIGFHIVVEGTPQKAGETYPCEIGFTHILGDDWGLSIVRASDNLCEVDQVNKIELVNNEESNMKIYPNPFSELTSLELTNLNSGLFEINLFDVQGNLVKRFKNLNPYSKLKIEREELSKGMYFFQLNARKKIKS